jgi:uncharacterized membrane protein
MRWLLRGFDVAETLSLSSFGLLLLLLLLSSL